MTEGKMRKTITAIVVAATLLVVILLSVLIYQWTVISVQNKRINAGQEKVDYWTQQNQEATNELDEKSSDYYKTWAAIEMGYHFPKNGD